MCIYNLNRKVWKNFKATNESLFKANVFTVNEICVNFQPIFPEELREATTLKSSSVLVTHVGKQSPALFISTCTTELTMANRQQLANAPFFFLIF